MKISYNWLRQYFRESTQLLPGPEKIAEYLTNCGLEVEGLHSWQSLEGGLKGVVIGEVITCEKHPNSDHLSITTVNIGQPDLLHIVCGASNVAAGQKVSVATLGTTLRFDGKEITLQKTKIRGEVSEGMICAEDELGLGRSHAGIMVLESSAKTGIPAAEYFGIEEDIVLEIGLTPNRSDATSHTGVARDLAAVLNTSVNQKEVGGKVIFSFPDVSKFIIDNQSRKTEVIVEDPKACPRYCGITMTGITVKDSPGWLQNRLNAIGLRPINNVVDVTNYLLHELGQPLHAFDADRIEGGTVIIKKLENGTKFITLDGQERELTSHDLMICDARSPMVIAGVFGGVRSGVTHETTNLFIESATFDPITIRKTARHHGLQTDASFRYERGTDIDINLYALKRATLLIKEVAGGLVSSDITDFFPNPEPEAKVFLAWKHLDRLIGQEIDRKEVKDILQSLFIKIVSESPEGLNLEIPHFRVDVTREADVIEEVLRIYGYNNLVFSDAIRSPLNIRTKPDPDKLQNVISDYLASAGFNEILNNSLTRSAYYEGNPVFPPENLVRMLNPLSRDLDVMRQTLLYGGLEAILYNQNRKIQDQKLFEFGNCYSKMAPGEHSTNPLDAYKEEKHLALFLTGNVAPESWNNLDVKLDFYHLKAYVQNILNRIGIDPGKLDMQPWESPLIREGMRLDVGTRTLVSFGIISKNVLKQYDLRQELYYADFSWNFLLKKVRTEDIDMTELPRFPAVRRDLALVLDRNVAFEVIEQLAFKTEKNILKQVGLFDVYEGEKIGADKKSYALSFILADEKKTLTDQEIDKTMNKLIRVFEEKLNAHLR